jgi:hypothetical protein
MCLIVITISDKQGGFQATIVIGKSLSDCDRNDSHGRSMTSMYHCQSLGAGRVSYREELEQTLSGFGLRL